MWELLDVAHPGDRASAIFDVAIRLLIALNIVAVILETVPALATRAGAFFSAFEVLSVTVFSIEYVGRVWSCVEIPRYREPVTGRIRYALSPLALIDLLAVLPSLLPALGVDLRMMRGVRLFRLFRILKLTRYSRSLHLIGRVFRRAREELVIALSAIALVLIVASSLMYYAEHGAQPNLFSSIPAAMWWGVVTLTTLGYGDVFPVTPFGRLMGGVFAIAGVLLVALPTAMLGAAFVEEFRREREEETTVATHENAGGERCPTCGGPVARDPATPRPHG